MTAQTAAAAFRADPPHPDPERGLPSASGRENTPPDVGRPALDRLRTEDRGTFGQRDVLVAAAALAIVEAIDHLATVVRQMAAVLEGTQQ